MVIGIDISKDWFDAAWQDGSKLHQVRLAYTPEGIEQLLQQVPAQAHFVMEATGVYHSRLALALHAAGRKLSVINPLIIKRYGQMKLSRVKTDRADAVLIMHYGIDAKPLLWTPPSDAIEQLRQAHGWLQDLLGERTRVINRRHAHRLRGQPSAFVGQQMHEQLRQLQRRIDACQQHLLALVKKSFASLYEQLQTIPSIGPKTATELIIITDGFRRFEHVKALAAYVGVSPTAWRSGSSVKGRGGIAKYGQGRMRQLLYVCSWTAKRCNPACKRLNERLRSAGKPPKVINVAIAHKLLRQAFACGTKNIAFSPDLP